MVTVSDISRFSEQRSQTRSDTFPSDALDSITAAVEAVPERVFLDRSKGTEISEFDSSIAETLPDYEYEGDALSGHNPNCELWSHLDFDYCVDLYDPENRIAIEVEKSERKNISDDLLKFQKGHRTQKDGRPKIEFGCLIVPVNYRGSGNLYKHSLAKLDFMRGVLFIDDVAVIGYRDPRHD
jgi:hypothetical protein